MEMPINYVLIVVSALASLVFAFFVNFTIIPKSWNQKLKISIFFFIMFLLMNCVHFIQGSYFPTYDDVMKKPILYEHYIKRYQEALGIETLSKISIRLYEINTPESNDFANYLYDRIVPSEKNKKNIQSLRNLKINS